MWPLSEVPEIREAQLEQGLGKCAMCGRPLKYKGIGRKPVICFRADCQIDYQRAYKVWMRGGRQ